MFKRVLKWLGATGIFFANLRDMNEVPKLIDYFRELEILEEQVNKYIRQKNG
jgi:hypothetical protein